MAYFSYSAVNVRHGQELGETPQAVSFLSGRHSGHAGQRLFIFLDFPGASASLCAELARVLMDGFNNAQGGVTSALRLGIRLLNDRVMQLNRGALPSRRIEGSVACALITEAQNVIIARAGPAITFARAANGAFEAHHPDPQTLSACIGQTVPVEVQFDHFQPQIGDVFVLTGARSTQGVSDALVRACMSKGDARMVAGYLNANVKDGQMVALVFSVDESPTPAVPPVAAPAAQGAPQPQRASSDATTERPRAAAPSARAAPAAASALVGALRRGLIQIGRAVRKGASAFVAQLLPDDPPAPAVDSARVITFLLAAIAVILPIVIGVTVGVLYFQLSGEAERLRLRTEAQTQLEIARQSTDPTQVRLNWDRALQLISQYQSLAPEDAATFEGAQQEARARLDQLQQITRVRPNLLARLSDGNRRIAAASLGAYVLDVDGQSASYFVLNAERTAVIGEPTPIQLDGQPPVADIAWATTANNRWRTEGLVLFSINRVLEYSSATGRTAPLQLPVNADTTPLRVQAGELYNNTVYLLDTQVGQIWRYRLGGDAFTQGDSYFRSPFRTLQDSLDMAIDGAIYVLQRNGAVLKYFNRQPVEFIITNLPEPLQNPVAIAVRGLDPNRGSVLVLDSASGSVIELTKSGRFVRQLRGENDELVGAIDFSLDFSSDTLYVITPTALYNFVLPPEPGVMSTAP